MSDLSIWMPLILVLVLLMLRIPVCMVFLSGAVFYFGFIATEMPLNMVLSKMVSAGMNMNLMAIPFFITAGLLMNYTGITSRMMKFADLCVGHMWGGLAQVNVLLSTLMGGLCGSSNADAAMQCKMLVPEMEKRGFNRAFSAAVTASSGSCSFSGLCPVKQHRCILFSASVAMTAPPPPEYLASLQFNITVVSIQVSCIGVTELNGKIVTGRWWRNGHKPAAPAVTG